MLKISLLIVIIGCLYSLPLTAQDEYEDKPLNWLEHALDTVRDGRSKIAIQYFISLHQEISNPAFWDSMATVAHRVGALKPEIWSLDRAGFYFTMQGDVRNAVIYLKKAIELAAPADLHKVIFNPLYHLADVYFAQGDIKSALENGFRATAIAVQYNDKRNIVLGYSLLGRIYSRIGYPNKALKVHLQALKTALENHLDIDLVALMSYGIAMDYKETGDSANAVKYFSLCSSYIDSFAPSPMQAALYSGAGMSYEMQRQPDKAMKFYLSAYKVSEQIGSKIMLVNSLVLLADNAYNKAHYKTAKAYATDALYLTKSINNKIQIPKIAQLLKRIYTKEGNFKTAMKYGEMYLLYRDSISNENVQKQAMEKEYEAELKQKEYNNRLLANKNRLQMLSLKQKNYITTGLFTGLGLVIIISLLLIRQNRISSAQQKMQLEQKLLRTQMNPHFIFNALQAIQNVVLKDDKKQAVEYLSLFASLTREVLNNSNYELIDLSDEISLITHYLQLQKLRFGGKFDYEIHIEGDMNGDLMVPPMMGQPFIENAVEHGMKQVASGGKIDVYYTLNGPSLNMKIIDNGYGMHAEPRNSGQHQSMAINITKERIQVMNKKQSFKAGFEITDAFPHEAERKGVCVSFVLPVKLNA